MSEAQAFPLLEASLRETDFRIVEGKGVEVTAELCVSIANAKEDMERVKMRNQDGKLYQIAILATNRSGTVS